jgi:GNAT superfamily N-acetyltransferase
MPITIKLIPGEDLESIIPLLRMANPDVDSPVLQQRLAEMRQQGYLCAGAYDRDELIAICGLWILTKYYVGKHIEPDNVFIVPDYQGQGIGKQLMQWVYEFGRAQGCVASELNCYLPNARGQKFWEMEGYEAIAYHYQKFL